MSILKYDQEAFSLIERETQEEALKDLDEIRANFSSYNGWIEIDGYAEQLKNGKWRAVRHQKRI